MILNMLKKFDSGVADVFDSGDINLENFEIIYIEKQLEKKFENLTHAFPDLILDSDDPKIYNLINTFHQNLTHILAIRKKTSEELAETVLSTVEDVYRELNVSCGFDGFSYFEKSHYLERLKKGNNPGYNINGVEMQMNRYYYQMKPYRFNYPGLSLFSEKNIYGEKFDAIKDKYNLELSLLMETIIMKKDIYLV